MYALYVFDGNKPGDAKKKTAQSYDRDKFRVVSFKENGPNKRPQFVRVDYYVVPYGPSVQFSLSENEWERVKS